MVPGCQGTPTLNGLLTVLPLVKGVLTWYSLIHSPPGEVPQALNELARVLVARVS